MTVAGRGLSNHAIALALWSMRGKTVEGAKTRCLQRLVTKSNDQDFMSAGDGHVRGFPPLTGRHCQSLSLSMTVKGTKHRYAAKPLTARLKDGIRFSAHGSPSRARLIKFAWISLKRSSAVLAYPPADSGPRHHGCGRDLLDYRARSG